MQVRLLGPLDVVVDGEPREVRGLRRKAILATLALRAGEVVSTDQLADVAWHSGAPATALNTLQSNVSHLRGILGGRQAITARPPGYQLALDDDGTDVLVAERLLRDAAAHADPALAARVLREALGLWRGRPLGDLAGLPWLEEQAGRLDLVHERIQRALAVAMLSAGEHERLLPDLERMAADQPLDEQICAHLMTALYRSGRQADALAAYARLRRALDDELGIDPGQPLRDLELAILRQDAALATPVAYGALTIGSQPALAALAGEAPAAAAEAGDGTSPASLAPGMHAQVPPVPAMVVHGMPAPAQLPRPAAGFSGRTTELAWLTAIASPAFGPQDPGAPADLDAPEGSGPMIAAITGTAGVGKTALALHWAHRSRAQFPDGQLYVNLRGFDPGGRCADPGEALRGFLIALGVPPESVPAGLGAQEGMYRSLLAGKRVLVVLDNARDAGHVRPLLPATPGCLTVVTSRDQLAGLTVTEGAHPLRLDLLSAGDARDLLARRVGAVRVAWERDAVNEIIDRCAGLPLALSIAAARAVLRPDFPLAVTAAELRDATVVLDPLSAGEPASDARAVLSWSYQALTPQAAQMFRLLGLHPAPDIGVSAAASLAGIDVLRARALLDELARASLCTEQRPGRYAAHDLLRAYARELATAHDSEQDLRAATRRMLGHYLLTARAALTLTEGDLAVLTLAPMDSAVTAIELSSHWEADAWLAAEHATIRTLTQVAAEAGLTEIAWQLAWMVSGFLLRRGCWADQEQIMRACLDAAQQAGDTSGEAHSLLGLGLGYLRSGRVDDAEAAYSRARWALETGDCPPASAATLYSGLAALAQHWQRHRESIGFAEQASALAVAAGNRPLQAMSLALIGSGHARLHDFQQAIACCKRGLAEIKGLRQPRAEGALWSSLGYAYSRLGDQQRAIACFERSLNLNRELADLHSEAGKLASLCAVYERMGWAQAARLARRHALRILTDLRHPDADLLASPEPQADSSQRIRLVALYRRCSWNVT
jgi:DNA-binding SARP family transcriptional activator/tetratricopeptide (TPR) repeat protein